MRALKIPSFSIDHKTYIVAPQGVTMELRCDCPAFRKARPCKHVRVYRSVEHAVKRCQSAHRMAGDAICATCVASLLVAIARKHQRTPPKKKKEAAP